VADADCLPSQQRKAPLGLHAHDPYVCLFLPLLLPPCRDNVEDALAKLQEILDAAWKAVQPIEEDPEKAKEIKKQVRRAALRCAEPVLWLQRVGLLCQATLVPGYACARLRLCQATLVPGYARQQQSRGAAG